MGRPRSLLRWGLCAIAGAVVMAVLPAAPASALTGTTFTRIYSGEGLGATDDFNDVSTDGGTTWTDAVVVPAQSGYSTITNTEWISSDADSGVNSRENTTTLFRRQFSMPPGITGSSGQFCIHADNAVTVTFNGTTIIDQTDPNDSGNFSGTPSCANVANLASGPNTVLFSVVNGSGPMGIDFEANITGTQDLDAPPRVLVPENVSIAATSPSGAAFGYGQVNAIDVTNVPIQATCTPATGALFPVGTTTVTCTATGTNQQTGTGSFTVTVLPFVTSNLPPVLALPHDLTLNAYSQNGRTVGYRATATDDSGLPPTVVCVPPSGALFPVGVTTVTCQATDDQNVSSVGVFTVTVVGPLERACTLLHDSLGITLTSKLVTKLRSAADALQQAGRGGDATTIRTLATKVRNGGTTYVRPALRQTVVQTVNRVMARACCPPEAPQA